MNSSEKKRLILVVDDHPKVLKFIEVELKLRGFEVQTATSGEEALEIVSWANPEIMLLDIIMPEMDGFEVLMKLRRFSNLPVICFSASPGNREEAMRLGADSFVVKPFHPDEIARRINKLL